MQVEVFTSGIWQTTSTVVSRGRACLVVDPAYFPRELDAIAAHAREVGPDAAVAFTHGHWDHVMGHAALPGAPVHVSRVLADLVGSGDPRAAAYLDAAREFDSRWYVPRPSGHAWPADLRGLGDEERLEIGGIALCALHLAGHSPEGLGLVVEEIGLLLVGDHLSPCEIPFVDDARAYRDTLARLLRLLTGGGAREVVPGHGHRMPAAEAAAIARADLDYLEALLAAGERRDHAAAQAIRLPRAAGVAGMRDHHRENCEKVGLALPAA
jgi:glyoxylase-like metal-dependent hydrolase (beta-lactamase superfamily II)